MTGRVRDAYGYTTGDRNLDGKVVVVGPFATAEQAAQAGAGAEVVRIISSAPHVPECPTAEKTCCAWMGECDCQCLCDILAPVAERAWREGYEAGAVAREDGREDAQ